MYLREHVGSAWIVGTALVLAGCGSSSNGGAHGSSGPDSGSDTGSGSGGPTDSGGDATTSTDGGAGSSSCDAGASFAYQYPGQAVRAGCLPLPEGVRIFDFAQDGGCDGSVNDTSAFAATPDNSTTLNVISFGRELFADAGPTSVYVQFSDLGACAADAGAACSTAFGSSRNPGCAFTVDVAGHDGDQVAGHLTAACTLTSSAMDASPPSVSLQSLAIEGKVVTICP